MSESFRVTPSPSPESLQRLQAEREKLKARNAEIVEMLRALPKAAPERARLVGEQTGNNLRLKTVNGLLAIAQREANGNTGAGAEEKQRGPSRLAIPGFVLSNGGVTLSEAVTKRDVAALMAMQALVIKFADHEKSLGEVEDRAEDLAEAAWEIADALYPEPPADGEQEPET